MVTLANRNRARIRVVLVHVVQVNQAMAGANGFSEELLYGAELTRERAPLASVVYTLFHFAP